MPKKLNDKPFTADDSSGSNAPADGTTTTTDTTAPLVSETPNTLEPANGDPNNQETPNLNALPEQESTVVPGVPGAIVSESPVPALSAGESGPDNASSRSASDTVPRAIPVEDGPTIPGALAGATTTASDPYVTDRPKPLAPPAPPAGLKFINPPPAGGIPQSATSVAQEREIMAGGPASNSPAEQPPGGVTAIAPVTDVVTREQMEEEFAKLESGMDRILYYMKHHNENTPDGHVVFGFGPITVTMGDLRDVYHNYRD